MVSVVHLCPFALASKHEIRVYYALIKVVKNLLSLFSWRAAQDNGNGLTNTFSVHMHVNNT